MLAKTHQTTANTQIIPLPRVRPLPNTLVVNGMGGVNNHSPFDRFAIRFTCHAFAKSLKCLELSKSGYTGCLCEDQWFLDFLYCILAFLYSKRKGCHPQKRGRSTGGA